ncbi:MULTISPECIES: hypothetical protein [Microbulbifer]|uniref:hypothetical protein n=1 Tax=Microbulbifer TaxID=48073 RepID=UPI001E402ABE|nr:MULTISPECIES: hypothetical protein [Microbulbifer]UHQ55993.1 hypothetical protein LVE68_03115 [Microbulbifer sp. YPW16]
MEPSELAASSVPAFATLYAHIRVIMGIVIGLGLTHLLRNLARLVEEPREDRLYWMHLGWVAFMVLYLLFFWWWEFRFSHTGVHDLATYLYLICYTLLLYLLCALLFPEKNSAPKDYRSLFFLRRKWFFTVLALVFLVDFGDTILKGGQYLANLGSVYVYRNLAFIVGSLVAIATSSRIYHGSFLLLGTAFQLFYFFTEYDSLV